MALRGKRLNTKKRFKLHELQQVKSLKYFKYRSITLLTTHVDTLKYNRTHVRVTYVKNPKSRFPDFSAIGQEMFKFTHFSLASFSRPAALESADWFVPPFQLVGMSRNATYLVCVTTHQATRIDCE